MRTTPLIALLVLASCVASAPTLSPSPVAEGLGGIHAAAEVWVYAGSLGLPPDPNVYSNAVIQAVPLRDGGWLIVRAADARRAPLCDPAWFGCGLVKRAVGKLERLDASGRVVAQEHGLELLRLTRIDVFEAQGVLVGAGPFVRNGDLHLFRLNTLDGIATVVGNCIAADASCFAYRLDYQAGQAALEERDPVDLHVSRVFAPLADASVSPPSIFPAVNLVIWRPQGGPIKSRALDTSIPLTLNWLARLQSACDVSRVGADRAFVMFGPSTCRGDSGWHAELIEVSTGRVVRVFAPGQLISGNHRDDVVLADSGVVVDPRDGGDGPTLAGGDPMFVDWDRGIAVAALSDGGAAVYRRRMDVSVARDVAFTTIATATCAEFENPRVMRATSGAISCASLASSPGSNRLLLATGRAAYGPASFAVTRIRADPIRRTLEIRYARTGRRTTVTDPSAAQIIELAESLPGEWLVEFSGETDDLYSARAFVVRFPPGP